MRFYISIYFKEAKIASLLSVTRTVQALLYMEEKKMRVIIGYSIDSAHIKGLMTNVRNMEANLRFLKDLSKFGGLELVKDYLRLEGKLSEYCLSLTKLPMSVKRVIYFEGGDWIIDNVDHRRKVIAENNPLNNLSPEEKEILRKIKSGRV